MIRYRKGLFLPENLVNLRGGVLMKCLPACFLIGLASAVLKYCIEEELGGKVDWNIGGFVENSAAYTGLYGIIGFLVIFRTQQAYSRFWDSCNALKKMQAEFFCTASNLVAFARYDDPSNVLREEVTDFLHLLIRLISLLHAMCLVSLHHKDGSDNWEDFNIEVIDARGIKAEALQALAMEECKVELLCQWIQSISVDALSKKVITIPPPIVSRIFQNLSNGMQQFYSSYRVAEIKYPFPYMQTTELVLFLNFLLCPIIMTNFVKTPLWAFIFTFFNTFTLLSLHVIAAELEDPFGSDVNDIDLKSMQDDMNMRLLMLLGKAGTVLAPGLRPGAVMEVPVSDAFGLTTSKVMRSAAMVHGLHEAFYGLRFSQAPSVSPSGTSDPPGPATELRSADVRLDNDEETPQLP